MITILTLLIMPFVRNIPKNPIFGLKSVFVYELWNTCHDNGSEFKKHFQRAIATLHLDDWWSREHTPKDNPINERFNRTLEDEFIAMGNMTTDVVEFNRRLTEWLVEYAFVRPHQSLGYITPWEYYQKTAKVLPMYSSRTLTDELISKIVDNNKDLTNKGWKERNVLFIQLGQVELQVRNNTIMLRANLIGLLVALVAIGFSAVNLQTSSNWEASQIKMLDDQKQIQQQIFEKIRDFPR